MTSPEIRVPCPNPRRLPGVQEPLYNTVQCKGLDLTLQAELHPEYHRFRVDLGADALNAQTSLLETCASHLLAAARWDEETHPARLVVEFDLGGALRLVLESRLEAQTRPALLDTDDALARECGLRIGLGVGEGVRCWGRLYAGYRFGYALLGLGWEGVCEYAARLLGFATAFLRALIRSYPAGGIL